MDNSTAETLVKIYAILAFIGAAVALIGGIMLMFVGPVMMLPNMNDAWLGGAMATVIGIVLLVFAFLDALVGWGLWTKKPWARIAALVLSILQVLSFPIGTIIGGFGIYLFGFEENVKKMFG